MLGTLGKTISGILGKINGPIVKYGGLVISAVSILALSGEDRVGYTVGISFAVLGLFFPRLFVFIKNFANPKFLPAFVGFGVAIVFAAHQGGLEGLAAVAGPLTAYDGMYFEQNYSTNA